MNTRVAVAAVVLAITACGEDATTTTQDQPLPNTSEADQQTTTSAPTTSAPAANTAPPTTRAPLQALTYTSVAQVDFPIWIAARPGGDMALLAQRSGIVRVFPDGPVVLDISDQVSVEVERGLLSMALHPEDESRLFLYYTDVNGDSVLSEYTLNGSEADPGSERVLLQLDQPAANHNGGTLQFGPDGALYLGLGDGGGSGDRYGNAQNQDTLLGGMVRIDPGSEEPELWQYGLRNPWRSWIDGEDIWIADVGQNLYEEVNVADITTSGLNYGWPITEARHCYEADDCDTDGFTMPILEVDRDDGSCSITGGVVYRDETIPELDGRFLFSDYCAGYLRSVDASGEVIDHTPDVGRLDSVVSFGVDGAGAVYVLTTKEVLRIDPVR